VVKQVVSPWETIARESTLAAGVEAKVRSVTVTVHAVSLALMAEEASSGRELLLGASVLPAAEWLEVGINELAAREGWLGMYLWYVCGERQVMCPYS
jgi:hypothetical protein